VLGLTIDSRLTWKEHIHGITAVASRKLGFLFGVRSYFSSTQLLALYKSLVRPHLEYCSHIWAGAAEGHLEPINKIQRRATRLVGDANLTSQLAPFDARRRVASLSCSTDTITVTVLTALLSWCHGRLRWAVLWGIAKIHLCRARTVTSQCSFIARTSREWKLLSCSVFPLEHDLQSFKSKVNKHIMTDLRNLDRTRPDQWIRD